MAVKNCGKKWFKSNFHDDKKVKEITSGINSVNKIIDKNEKEHWVIVGLTNKNDKELLGIRWFWGNSGFPSQAGWGTWLHISKEMAKTLSKNSHIDDFIS